MSDFSLNWQQEEASDGACDWLKNKNKQVYEISGPAGSGKTTIVYHIMKRFGIEAHEVLFMAYVGKAAMALAMKGNYAKTIHGSIYEYVKMPAKDEYGNIIKKHDRPVMTYGFKKKEQLPSHIRLLVVDEGSMVEPRMGADILSFGIPVLVLGDLNQLPPIFGNPFFLNSPDYVLTKIMRQAEDNPIIRLSQMALHGEYIRDGKYGDTCIVIPKEKILDDTLMGADMILCGKNKTRDAVNRHVRFDIRGIEDKFPVIGDKIVCRKNNWNLSLPSNPDISLINGMVGYVDAIDRSTYKKGNVNIDFRPDFTDDIFADVNIGVDNLFLTHEQRKVAKYSPFDKCNKFEFGYAISVHMSQGSQFNNVVYFDEYMGGRDFYNKLKYTAITRAVEKLIIGS